VPKLRPLTRLSLRVFAALLGLGLLAYLVFRAGPGVVWEQVQVVGWGFALIIILGGRLSQLIRTCAWRQTITYDIQGLRWSRSIGAQLASDACGQLGVAGKLLRSEGLLISMSSVTETSTSVLGKQGEMLFVGAEVVRRRAMPTNGAVEHPTQPGTMGRSRMDAEPNDSARVLIDDDQDPVGPQRCRLAPEQINPRQFHERR
jgi:hypothetical protein